MDDWRYAFTEKEKMDIAEWDGIFMSDIKGVIEDIDSVFIIEVAI